MNVLGIETSGKTGSVGAFWDAGTLERPFPGGTSHGRDLAPALSALVAELGWRLADFDLIAVSAGPGSYTGLRIGMAFAKALAFALDRPLVGVPSFDAMARTAPSTRSISAIRGRFRRRSCARSCVSPCGRRRRGQVEFAQAP